MYYDKWWWWMIKEFDIFIEILFDNYAIKALVLLAWFSIYHER
jgi:hypothetical protein